MLCGAPAAGKSWVVNKLQEMLKDKFIYISYDSIVKRKHMDLLIEPTNLPKVYDPTFKISTIIRRHSDVLDIHPVFIHEELSILEQRMISRGGTLTETIGKRNGEILKRHMKYGGFLGTSQEVLDHLLRELGDTL